MTILRRVGVVKPPAVGNGPTATPAGVAESPRRGTLIGPLISSVDGSPAERVVLVAAEVVRQPVAGGRSVLFAVLTLVLAVSLVLRQLRGQTALHEFKPGGFMGRSSASGDSEFAEDGAQMGVHSPRADHQTLGDLGIAQAGSKQPQDIQLSVGEAHLSRLECAGQFADHLVGQLNRLRRAKPSSFCVHPLPGRFSEPDSYAADRPITGVPVKTGADFRAVRVEPCCGGSE